MGWLNTFLASRVVGVAAPADSCDETVINNAANDTHKAIRIDAENPAGGQDAQIPEAIKRRQIALITRYVMTVRAR
jgi:hypothetical protein